jgi:hypothetical protein
MCGLSSTSNRIQAAQFATVWAPKADQQRKQEDLVLTIIDDVVYDHFDMLKLYFPRRVRVG